MYREITDKKRLLEYWRDEKNSVRWYQESNETKKSTVETFLKFCADHTVYEIDGCALIYCKEVAPKIVQIHFSVLRGSKFDIESLKELRNDVFRNGTKVIFGNILKQNRPLRKICDEVGFYWNGLEEIEEREGKRPFRFLCYAMDRRDLIVAPNAQLFYSCS
jgi:hypothetical protein